VLDLSEQKRAEQEPEKLRQLEAELAHINRVSTLGEMAASLAHEIKQPIAAAITSAHSCIQWLAHEPPHLDRARAAAARIDKYGNRAAEIIDRIRFLYKKSPPQRELVDVNGIIQEMLTLLKGEATRYTVAMRTDLAAELPKIMADRVQLQQVFMNLVLCGSCRGMLILSSRGMVSACSSFHAFACRLIGEDQRPCLANPPCRDRQIAVAQAGEHVGFLGPCGQPQDPAGAIHHGIRQRHPPPALVFTRQRYVGIGDLEYRISRYQRSGVPVRPQTHVDQIQDRGRSGDITQRCCIPRDSCFQISRLHGHGVDLLRTKR
jgi:hypothetical protein